MSHSAIDDYYMPELKAENMDLDGLLKLLVATAERARMDYVNTLVAIRCNWPNKSERGRKICYDHSSKRLIDILDYFRLLGLSDGDIEKFKKTAENEAEKEYELIQTRKEIRDKLVDLWYKQRIWEHEHPDWRESLAGRREHNAIAKERYLYLKMLREEKDFSESRVDSFNSMGRLAAEKKILNES